MNKSYHFIKMTRGLEHPVFCNTKCVIPAGAEGVRIAFRQSHLQRWDNDLQKFVNLNVYLWHGRLYHA